jgi:hypothetical protein
VDTAVACTTDRGNATYLRNESDAVWVLRNKVGTTYCHWFESLRIVSFRSIFGTDRVLLVPKGVITTGLPSKPSRAG